METRAEALLGTRHALNARLLGPCPDEPDDLGGHGLGVGEAVADEEQLVLTAENSGSPTAGLVERRDACQPTPDRLDVGGASVIASEVVHDGLLAVRHRVARTAAATRVG